MLSEKLPVFNDSIDVSGKRVIVRVDFNVPAEDDKIIDDYRIARTLPLLRKLLERGARIVLLSHLTEKKTHRSFTPLLEELQRVTGFDIAFSSTIFSARQRTEPVVLLENLRVFHGEEAADSRFAKELSMLGDIYINEDFSQSHRPYASIIGLPKLLPSFVGPLFYEEVQKLEEALSPARPFMLILGGVKFTTKIGVLEHFLGSADTIFIGGGLANTFLAARGFSVGASSVEQDALAHVRDTFIGKPNIMLPTDVRVEGNAVRDIADVSAHEIIYDLGPASSAHLASVARDMKTVLWNGPMGYMEGGYTQGTTELVDTLAACGAKVIIGGGDTMAVIRVRRMEDAFYHLSTGGGAMLEFLAKGTLPGIEAILERKV